MPINWCPTIFDIFQDLNKALLDRVRNVCHVKAQVINDIKLIDQLPHFYGLSQ